MGIFDKFFKPNIDKLKENQNVEGLIKALDHKDRNVCLNAIEALRNFDTDRTKKSIKTYEVKEYEKAQILTQKGIILSQQCKFKNALRCFENALEHDSQSAEIWCWKSRMQAVIGDFKAALNAVDKALQLNPKHIDALKQKASLLGPSQYLEQLDCYNKVLAIDPLDIDSWTGKVSALTGMRRYTEAIQYCKEAIELAPANAMLWYETGSTLEEAGRMNEAITAYHRFVELATEQGSTRSDTRAGEMSKATERTLVSFVREKISKYKHQVRPKETPQIQRMEGDISKAREKLKTHATIDQKIKSRKQKDRINRVEICFDSPKLPYAKPKVIKDLIRHFDLEDSFTLDVHISTSYGKVSGVVKALQTECVPEELMAFVIARAFIIGFDEKEIEKMIPRPFNIGGTSGILIAGNVKEPWAER